MQNNELTRQSCGTPCAVTFCAEHKSAPPHSVRKLRRWSKVKAMTEVEFSNISWPDEFYIEFDDGEKQLFVSGQGVVWDSGCNESGTDENRENINCCWQKKSPSQQNYKMIQVWVDEIKSIQLTNGTIVWQLK